VPKVAFFVHDLLDAAVHRRLRMLRAGGSAVTLMGFKRNTAQTVTVEGVRAVELGRTEDGMLLRRVMSIVAAVANLKRIAQHVRGADVVLARNLEMLLIAAIARKRFAPHARLVYECLDIHGLLVSNHFAGKILRFIESRLWRGVDLLLTSSPAFVRHYFVPRGFPAEIKVVENKVLSLAGAELPAPSAQRTIGPPWRIGWFGVIRCRKSLDILSSIAAATDGAVEVVIRGRPSDKTFLDLEAAIATRSHVKYLGPYRNPEDLREIYRDVHFIWSVDYYESGRNSAWLLPNRIYEGIAYGAVPIGLAGIETGDWLYARSVGVVLGEPLCDQLVSFFRSLDPPAYASLVRAVSGLPRKFVISDDLDCSDLVRSLRGGGEDHFRELSDSTLTADAHTRSHIEART
jgi:succinoglycan biosynthesis protein ExoL